MKIWVDADACPGAIVEIIVRAAHKREIHTVFVSNKLIQIPESPYLSCIRVEQGPDVADNYIAEKTEPEDIVITQDIPLAAAVVPIGAAVISVHGVLFTPSNIGERLSVRNFMQGLRDSGVETAGPKAFSVKDKQRFANTFDSVISKRIKK